MATNKRAFYLMNTTSAGAQLYELVVSVLLILIQNVLNHYLFLGELKQ